MVPKENSEKKINWEVQEIPENQSFDHQRFSIKRRYFSKNLTTTVEVGKA
jgi:hypothetical protein